MRFHIILIITAEINPLHPHCPETSGRFFTLEAYTIRVESSKLFVRCSPLQITEKQSRPEEIHSEFPTPVFTIIQEMLSQIIVCRFAVDDDLVSDVVDDMHSVVLKNPKSHTSCWSHNHDIRCHEEGECRLQIIHFLWELERVSVCSIYSWRISLWLAPVYLVVVQLVSHLRKLGSYEF